MPSFQIRATVLAHSASAYTMGSRIVYKLYWRYSSCFVLLADGFKIYIKNLLSVCIVNIFKIQKLLMYYKYNKLLLGGVGNTGLILSSCLFAFPFELDSRFQDFSYVRYLWILRRFIDRSQFWLKSEESICTDMMTSVLCFPKLGHCSVDAHIVENWFAQRLDTNYLLILMSCVLFRKACFRYSLIKWRWINFSDFLCSAFISYLVCSSIVTGLPNTRDYIPNCPFVGNS